MLCCSIASLNTALRIANSGKSVQRALSSNTPSLSNMSDLIAVHSIFPPQVARQLKRSLPGASLAVFSDRDLGSKKAAVEAALKVRGAVITSAVCIPRMDRSLACSLACIPGAAPTELSQGSLLCVSSKRSGTFETLCLLAARVALLHRPRCSIIRHTRVRQPKLLDHLFFTSPGSSRSRAPQEADVFFGSLLFDYDQVEWLREQVRRPASQHAHCYPMLGLTITCCCLKRPGGVAVGAGADPGQSPC